MNQKTGWSIVAVVVVLVLIGVWAWSANYDSTAVDTNGNQVATTTTDQNVQGSGTEVGTEEGVPAIAYANALQIYANKRIQFSTPQGENNCQAAPNTLTFKGGTKFMLDNRMDKTASIHFSSGVTYTLPAYGFQIVSLVTPTSYNVDCNASQNVVKVQIQS